MRLSYSSSRVRKTGSIRSDLVVRLHPGSRLCLLPELGSRSLHFLGAFPAWESNPRCILTDLLVLYNWLLLVRLSQLLQHFTLLQKHIIYIGISWFYYTTFLYEFQFICDHYITNRASTSRVILLLLSSSETTHLFTTIFCWFRYVRSLWFPSREWSITPECRRGRHRAHVMLIYISPWWSDPLRMYICTTIPI